MFLDLELESVKRPPDMISFLQEERRLQKLLYRQSICSESDSTQGESRDSGVELDKNNLDENPWNADDTHSRQNSEVSDRISRGACILIFWTRGFYRWHRFFVGYIPTPQICTFGFSTLRTQPTFSTIFVSLILYLQTYANTSSTSEEDEIMKKEREILEILELEEQKNYETEAKNECSNLGECLNYGKVEDKIIECDFWQLFGDYFTEKTNIFSLFT